mgnify:CR=1 FL=1
MCLTLCLKALDRLPRLLFIPGMLRILPLYGLYFSNYTRIYVSYASSGTCDPVKNEISGTFLADQNGFWQSNPSFKASQAKYEFELKSLKISNAQYGSFMQTIEAAIEKVGTGAFHRDLYQNILYWTMFEYPIPGTSNKFYFKADNVISTVFNKRYPYAAVASAWMTCAVQPTTSSDVGDATFTISFDHESHMNEGRDNIMNPEGYMSVTDSQFTIDLDMRSFMIVAAVR